MFPDQYIGKLTKRPRIGHQFVRERASVSRERLKQRSDILRHPEASSASSNPALDRAVYSSDIQIIVAERKLEFARMNTISQAVVQLGPPNYDRADPVSTGIFQGPVEEEPAPTQLA